MDTAFRLVSVERMPGCVADITWLRGVDGFEDGCERRRRPAPSLRGAELVDGRYSEGTSSPGRRINGDAILGGDVCPPGFTCWWFLILKRDQ